MRLTIGYLLPLGLAAALMAGCGDDDDGSSAAGKDPAKLRLTATKSGLKGPASVPAGVVEVTFHNAGKQPADAQIISMAGNHTPAEVLKVVSSEGRPIPDWLGAPGGAGVTPPGATDTTTVVLKPGRHVAIDTSREGKP